MLRIHSSACTTKFYRHQVNDVQNIMKDEWTEKYVRSFIQESYESPGYDSLKAIADAHNASLDELRIASNAALEQLREKLDEAIRLLEFGYSKGLEAVVNALTKVKEGKA